MASLYNNPEYVAKLPKTTFNMYQPIHFSSIPGAIVPVFCDFLHPGEKIKGSIEMFSRTRELETAAMADIDEFVDYFFVPAEKLSQIFGEWYFNIDDRKSALRPAEIATRAQTLPNIDASLLRGNFKGMVQNDIVGSYGDKYGFDSFTSGMVRLFQHFRYDVFALFDSRVEDTSAIWNISLMPFLAYQAIYYDYYRDTNWEDNDVLAYNADDWLVESTDYTALSRWYKIFQLHYRRQNSDYYTNVKPSPLQNATGMLRYAGEGEDGYRNVLMRVNQWLDGTDIKYEFGKYGTGSPEDMLTNVGISTDYSGLDVSNVRVPSDLIGAEMYGNLTINDAVTVDVDAQDTYRPLDGGGQGSVDTYYEAQAKASSNINAWNLHPNTSSGRLAHDHYASFSLSEEPGNFAFEDQTFDFNGDFTNLVNNLKSSVNSASIRTMFALEKLAKVTGRAGKHYDDQVLAHFGYKVPRGFSDEVQHIGEQHSQIHIGEVISPSTIPDGSVAGEIVGKGYGNMNQGSVDFTAPVHGYFMAIYSAAPRRSYTPVGSPKEYSQLRREDFLIPEFMNLGQQPLFTDEFSRVSQSLPVQIWQWRYSEAKTRVPMAIGAFSNFYHDNNGVLDTSVNGVLQDWTINYPVLNILPSAKDIVIRYQNFLVAPSAFNSIMTLQYQPYKPSSYDDYHVARVFDRDPLFHHMQCKFYKTSYMTTFGEPRID